MQTEYHGNDRKNVDETKKKSHGKIEEKQVDEEKNEWKKKQQQQQKQW